MRVVFSSDVFIVKVNLYIDLVSFHVRLKHPCAGEGNVVIYCGRVFIPALERPGAAVDFVCDVFVGAICQVINRGGAREIILGCQLVKQAGYTFRQLFPFRAADELVVDGVGFDIHLGGIRKHAAIEEIAVFVLKSGAFCGVGVIITTPPPGGVRVRLYRERYDKLFALPGSIVFHNGVGRVVKTSYVDGLVLDANIDATCDKCVVLFPSRRVAITRSTVDLDGDVAIISGTAAQGAELKELRQCVGEDGGFIGVDRRVNLAGDFLENIGQAIGVAGGEVVVALAWGEVLGDGVSYLGMKQTQAASISIKSDTIRVCIIT